jgi:hypothetical protein
MIRLYRSFRSLLAREDGTATIEFALTFPVLIIIFCASFESSIFMVRSVSLERSVDLVVRDLRLGKLGIIEPPALKKLICERSSVLGDIAKCVTAMAVELRPVSTTNFAVPSTPASCVDRNALINPTVESTPPTFILGGDNEIMLMRVCLKANPMFPTTVFGVRMNNPTADGGYSIVTASTFVVEPKKVSDE